MAKPHVSFETQGIRYESHLTDTDSRAAVEGIDLPGSQHRTDIALRAERGEVTV